MGDHGIDHGVDQGAEPTVRVFAFSDLDAATAYQVWRLRQDVFVVEQECPYPDLDARDAEPGARHVVLTEADAGVVGYLRILDEGDHARIGRVVLDRRFRGRGLADRMMRAALQEIGDREVLLSAQEPLAQWYAAHGFVICGESFLEDGIPHVPMRLRNS